jgi:hypothetical protein
MNEKSTRKAESIIVEDPPIIIADQGFPLDDEARKMLDGINGFSIHSKNPIVPDEILGGFYIDMDTPPRSLMDQQTTSIQVGANEPWAVTISSGGVTISVPHFGAFSNRVSIMFPFFLQPSLGTKGNRYYLFFQGSIDAVNVGSLGSGVKPSTPRVEVR